LKKSKTSAEGRRNLPAIWMLSETKPYGSGQKVVEIDIHGTWWGVTFSKFIGTVAYRKLSTNSIGTDLGKVRSFPDFNKEFHSMRLIGKRHKSILYR